MGAVDGSIWVALRAEQAHPTHALSSVTSADAQDESCHGSVCLVVAKSRTPDLNLRGLIWGVAIDIGSLLILSSSP